MPALTARDLEARLTGQAEKSGGYVIESVCFENHQTDARTTPVDVSPTMGASRNGQASNNNPLVVAIDMDKNKLTNADKPVRKGGAGFGISTKGASYTLTARDQHAVAYAIDSMGSNAMKSKNPKSGCREIECAPTLTTVDSAPVKHQGGTAVVAFLPGNSAKAHGLGAEEEVSPTLVKGQGASGNKVTVAAEVLGVFDMEAGKSSGRGEAVDVSPTMLALHGTDPHAVCIGFNCEAGTHVQTPKEELGETLAARHKCGVAIGGAVSFEPGLARREGEGHRFIEEVSSTLRADMGDNRPAVATVDYIVRRLTPLECERLQGLPDGYTKIPYRGKPADECPDTPRYKALGNGWAVNCARWVCRRIQDHDRTHEQENENGNG